MASVILDVSPYDHQIDEPIQQKWEVDRRKFRRRLNVGHEPKADYLSAIMSTFWKSWDHTKLWRRYTCCMQFVLLLPFVHPTPLCINNVLTHVKSLEPKPAQDTTSFSCFTNFRKKGRWKEADGENHQIADETKMWRSIHPTIHHNTHNNNKVPTPYKQIAVINFNFLSEQCPKEIITLNNSGI